MDWFYREIAKSETFGFLSLLSLCIMRIQNRSSDCLVNKDAVGHFEYVYSERSKL
mgnify:CR=1 FL=1